MGVSLTGTWKLSKSLRLRCISLRIRGIEQKMHRSNWGHLFFWTENAVQYHVEDHSLITYWIFLQHCILYRFPPRTTAFLLNVFALALPFGRKIEPFHYCRYFPIDGASIKKSCSVAPSHSVGRVIQSYLPLTIEHAAWLHGWWRT